jgi:hypothetical protein
MNSICIFDPGRLRAFIGKSCPGFPLEKIAASKTGAKGKQ